MKCQKCNKHEATINWVGEGGILDYTHGMYERWCECCALKENIKHAKKMAKRLSILERKLERIKCK
jgi:hypothetical protein